jgi:hypothetical protein
MREIEFFVQAPVAEAAAIAVVEGAAFDETAVAMPMPMPMPMPPPPDGKDLHASAPPAADANPF